MCQDVHTQEHTYRTKWLDPFECLVTQQAMEAHKQSPASDEPFCAADIMDACIDAFLTHQALLHTTNTPQQQAIPEDDDGVDYPSPSVTNVHAVDVHVSALENQVTQFAEMNNFPVRLTRSTGMMLYARFVSFIEGKQVACDGSTSISEATCSQVLDELHSFALGFVQNSVAPV